MATAGARGTALKLSVGLFVCASAALAACDNTADTSPSPAADAGVEASVATPGTLDDKGITAAAAAYSAFSKINRDAFRTAQHAENPMVDVFANDLAASTYRSIDPSGKAPANFAFAPGSMVIKEMKDAAGGRPILTVMYKKAAGYDPANGDWWYGRLNADGTPTNAAFVGKVDFCVGCHAGTAQWDHAWGVPASNQLLK